MKLLYRQYNKIKMCFNRGFPFSDRVALSRYSHCRFPLKIKIKYNLDIFREL